MPKEWHDRHSVNKMEDGDNKDLYRRIIADRKPYFMKYIYPALMTEYNTYTKNTDKNALREFNMTVKELYELDERTERQDEFLHYYEYRLPVGINDCVMNKICHRFEEHFDGYVGSHNATTNFDYSIMKSGAEYTARQFYAIKKLYEDYNKRLKNYAIFSEYERVDKNDSACALEMMNEEFIKACDAICPDPEALCDIILDLCYTKNSTKRFVWAICGEQIIQNLLNKNNGIISFPTKDPNGDIIYLGERYRLEKKKEWLIV